jgi:hypothetical protein
VPLDSNPFPDRVYPYGSTANGTREPHHGVEFPVPYGTPILAAADGVVFFAGSDEQESRFSPWENFYGNLVVVEHNANGQIFYTLYAHLSELDVETGQTVQTGDPLGKAGMSGAATGPHLHFEVRQGGTAYTDTRNPALWLRPADPARNSALRGKVINRSGEPIYAHLNVQLLDESGRLLTQYDVETYAPEHNPVPTADENFALGDLLPGRYRITLYASGKIWEQFVQVPPHQIAEVVFVLP